MPPPDYFSSGASKRDSVRWQQGHATQYLDSKRTGSRAYTGGGTSRYGSEQDYDDACTVVPDDSISVFSSSRSGHSKSSARSGGSGGRARDARTSNAERNPAYVGSGVGSRRSEGYGDSGSGGWGPDEQPYFDEANQYYVRNVRPDYTR